LTNPFYDPYRVLTKIYADGAHLKIALAETDLEELNRSRTVKTVYGVLENDAYLSLCIKTFAPKSPKQAARVLLKISLYWLIYLKKPRYMVTDTAVELCKKLGKGGMAGFLNALVRRGKGYAPRGR
jgi:transcription termination factor NusB